MKIKRGSFLLEFLKSGPFMALLIFALLILMGILVVNHHRNTVRMKENVLYVVPKHN